jgi:hypothetical protein
MTFGEQYCVDVWKVAQATGDWRGAAYTLTLAALHTDHAGYIREAFEYSDMAKLADVRADIEAHNATPS